MNVMLSFPETATLVTITALLESDTEKTVLVQACDVRDITELDFGYKGVTEIKRKEE